MTNTSSVIIGSVVVITATTVIKDVREHKDPVLPAVSGFMLGSALLLFALVSAPLAKAFAVMGVIGALLTNGPATLAIIRGVK